MSQCPSKLLRVDDGSVDRVHKSTVLAKVKKKLHLPIAYTTDAEQETRTNIIYFVYELIVGNLSYRLPIKYILHFTIQNGKIISFIVGYSKI